MLRLTSVDEGEISGQEKSKQIQWVLIVFERANNVKAGEACQESKRNFRVGGAGRALKYVLSWFLGTKLCSLY